MMETTVGKYSPSTIVEEQEDLASEHGYFTSDEMEELSDSQSSRPSHSRPTTPSEPQPAEPSKSRIRSQSQSRSDTYSVPQKAVHLLGLVPGSLNHALACLESARDEARRLSEEPTTPYVETSNGSVKVNRMDRARKALSVALPSVAKMPGVVVGAGGREEELRRERRRKVADGVLHWQKEVARLQEVELVARRAIMSQKRRR